jgi:hypothetical protein
MSVQSEKSSFQFTGDTKASARKGAPAFCNVIIVNRRGYVLRTHLEAYKAALICSAPGGIEPLKRTRSEIDVLVPLKVAAAELGVGRRTIGRRIAESRSASSNAPTAADMLAV